MALPGGRREGYVTGTAPGAAGTLQSVTSHPKESPVGRALTNSTVWGPSCSSRKKSYRARRCFCAEDSEANVGRTAAQVTERRLRARPCARTGEHRPCGRSGLRGTRATRTEGPRLSRGSPSQKQGPGKSRPPADSGLSRTKKGQRQRLSEWV